MKIIQRGSDAKEKIENFELKSIPMKVVDARQRKVKDMLGVFTVNQFIDNKK